MHYIKISSCRRLCRFTLSELALVALIVGLVATWLLVYCQRLVRSARDLDVAIVGNGYFQLHSHETGETYYARSARLSLSTDGTIMVGQPFNGCHLDPPITIPQDAERIRISPSGEVSVFSGAQNLEIDVGCILLARFANATGLKEVFPNLYIATYKSGAPIIDQPGQNDFGVLQQGWIEKSDSQLIVDPMNLWLILTAGLGGFGLAKIWHNARTSTANKRLDLEIRDELVPDQYVVPPG